MFDEVIVCLDGSSLAEKIIPLARGIAAAKDGRLSLLRVVEDRGGRADGVVETGGVERQAMFGA